MAERDPPRVKPYGECSSVARSPGNVRMGFYGNFAQAVAQREFALTFPDLPSACRRQTSRRSVDRIAGAGADRFDFRQVLFGPFADRAQRLGEGVAKGGERVLDPRRHFGKDSPLHEPVSLQLTQGVGQHLLRDAADIATQLAKPAGAAGQCIDDNRRPLVRDERKHTAGSAIRVKDVWLYFMSYHMVINPLLRNYLPRYPSHPTMRRWPQPLIRLERRFTSAAPWSS